MATDIIVKPDFKLLHLVPISGHEQEVISGLRENKTYRAKLTWATPRSVKQNRFYWAVLGTVVDNHSFYVRSEPLHLWLKTRMGYVSKIVFHDGTMQTEVDSTAFDKMPSDEFRVFLDAALDIICMEVLPGTEKRLLLRHVEGVTGITYREMFVPEVRSNAA